MFCDGISSHDMITSYCELVKQDCHEYRTSSGGDVSYVWFKDIFEGLFPEGSVTPDISILFLQNYCAENIVGRYVYNRESVGCPR